MKKSFKALTCTLVSISIMFSVNAAEAKRFGGGKSSGRQNTTAIQRANDPANAPPMQQNNQQQNSNAQQSQQAQAPQMQQQPQKSRFGGMGAILGGVAAGLGMAWLASKLGLGAGFGNILMIIAVIMLAVMAFRMFKKRKENTNASPNINNMQNYAYSSGTPQGSSSTHTNQGFQPTTPNTNTENKTFSTSTMQGDTLSDTTISNNINSYQVAQSNNYPIAINELVNQAPNWFMNVQQLSDTRNLTELQKVLSPELFANIKADLQNAPALSKTVTQNLQYVLLDWRETQFEFLATVQYKGDVSEDGAAFSPINEAWTFTKDKTSGLNSLWKLDGISQLNII